MSDNEHISIDIETLGTERDSVILSLGAVKFDHEKIYEDDGLYLSLKWQPQMDNGGTVTEGTIRFWLSQHRAARDAVLNKSGAVHHDKALQQLSAWFKKNIRAPKNCCVWAKGPSFDLSLISDLYQRSTNSQPPWPFWAERCVRTAIMLNAAYKVPHPDGMVEHHAFWDAVYQASQVRRFLVACGPAARRPPKKEDTGDDLLS